MSVRRYLRPFYGWLVEKRECDRALFEYQVLGIMCAPVSAIIISRDVQIRTTSVIVGCCLKIIGPAARLNKQLPPKAMVNAILAGRALQRTRLVGMTPEAG